MEKLVFKRPEAIKQNYNMNFCPGCDHGIAVRLIAELIDEFNLRENTIAVASVGCSVLLSQYLNLDIIESAHGRALAVATGVKRANPDKFVFTYQGDGDLASIGLAETLHAVNREEYLTTICINNTNYGMTGGQAAPTTLIGQVTTTTLKGRQSGHPMKISETIAVSDGAVYVARVSLDSPREIQKAKKSIKNAFLAQIQKKGFGFVEALASCPTNWHMSPKEAHEHIKNNVQKVFPPGILKDFVVKQ